MIFTLFRAELKMILRDRRILVTSILMPILITPLMFLGSSWGFKKREKTLQEMTYRYAVAGTEAAKVRELMAATRTRLQKAPEQGPKNKFKFDEITCAEPLTALSTGGVHLVIEGLAANQPTAGSASSNSPSAKTKRQTEHGEAPVAGVPTVRLTYRADRDDSAAAEARVSSALEETRQGLRRELLKTRGFELAPSRLAVISEVDVATRPQVAGLALGRLVTLMLLFFIVTSGAVVATDSLAGEKERGTLETLLTTSAGRVEILAAKSLTILAVALLITVIQAANLLVYIGFKLLPVPANLAAAVSPGVVGLLFILYVPLAALAANVLLLVSGYARSYKEAQMYFMPTLLLAILPALAPLLPGVPLRSILVLLPIANIALAAKEVLTGVFDWPMLLLAWLTTAAAAAWTTRLGVRVLSTEKLLTASDTDAAEFAGGPALFEKRVLRWFALLWATLLLVGAYMEKADVRVQITINLVVLFFGASCLMIWGYRLDLRTALALRAPKPAVWLGVLFAVPGGILTALGVSRLSTLLLPMPQNVAEGFSEAVMPANIPLPQLLFFLGLMPGIFEEVAFRGLLLHGLRRRLHPVTLALVVGATFGFFHVALFRLVPTACLGIMFAAVTLLTGSIFPAMLWHGLNNALGVLAAQLRIPESDLEPICYIAGAGMLAAAFLIFWRNRTPYPELRWKNKRAERIGLAMGDE